MRILSAVRHSIDPKLYYGSLWSANFHPALRAMGHDVIESQIDLAPASRFMETAGGFNHEQLRIRGEITGQIVDELKASHRQRPVDLFLSYFYNSHFDSAAFDEIHRMGIRTVNFYCNSIYQFELTAEIAPKVNVAWHAEKHAQRRYLAVGANPVWVQMAADPEVYHPVRVATRQAKATFVGLRYCDRATWMAALIRANVPLDIYGPGWSGEESAPVPASRQNSRVLSYFREIQRNVQLSGLVRGLIRSKAQLNYRKYQRHLMPLFAPFAKGPIPFTQICDVFSSYDVVLNLSNVWADGRPGSELIPHVRLRDFEGPMCRTCFLTGHTDEITDFYEVGREIDTYRSETELIDKTRYYLSHPQAAEQLRQAGYERARRDHTWMRRFEQLFARIGMS